MIVNKAAMSKGVNKHTMVVYANDLSTLLLLPYALFIFHRSSPDRPPPLTFSIPCIFFLLAFLACSGQIFGYIVIDYSSPTLGAAMLNLIPAFTFILALIFRMEIVYWRRLNSQAKVLGTIVLITGASICGLILQSWCVWKAGALYCSMFKPLGIIFGGIMSVIFLGDPFYFGSLVGAVIIVTGFYGVMWGKAEEEKLVEDGGRKSESLGQNKVPLLQNNVEEKHNCTSIQSLEFQRIGRQKQIMAKIAALPIVGMVLAECAQAGLMIVSKAAMSTGMNNLIFVCYSNALAAFVLLPTSLFFHRSTERPPITSSILCWFFLLGLLGCIAQLIGYAGINYSSPTLGTAMLNLIPAFTFVLAVIFRMEKIDGRSRSTLAKTLGTIVSISGAFIVTLYKGPPLLMTASVDLLSHNQLFLPQSNWVIGGMLLGFYCVVAAAFLIIQASVLKKYPAELIIVFYYCFFVAIQSVVVLWFVERDLSAWALNPKLRLFAVLYSGVFGSAFQVGVSTWCLNRTGPVFVSMFKPLGIVVAVAIGVIFLGDTFYLGSLIGAIVIVTGFYSVIWGKANEEKMDDDAEARSLASKKQRIPLLQNIIEEI